MNTVSFLSGIYMATFAASGVIFLKFYKASGDRFFKLFSYACWAIALERVAILFFTHVSANYLEPETQSWVYLFRLAAFVIILFAIVDRNRRNSNTK